MIAIATETDRSNPVNFASCCLFPILVTLTSSPTNTANAKANAPPLIISSGERRLTSFTTPTIKAMATLILRIIPPTFPTLFPALFATKVMAITNTPNAVANIAAFLASSSFMVPDNFTTPIMRSIAMANFVIIFPTLSAFFPRSPFVKKPIAAATPSSPAAIAATPRRPCFISSWFIPPTILAATATMRIAAAICARLIFSPFTLPPNPFSVFPNSKEVSDSLDTAITKPANITLKAKITPTACHNLVGSNIVITATAPTRIKIATAKFFIPSVLCSNPIPLNILPRPFVILEKLFINLGSLSLNVETVSAALLRISPNPPNGSVKFSKIFRTFLPNIAAVTLVIIANILSHCIFPFSSERKSNML